MGVARNLYSVLTRERGSNEWDMTTLHTDLEKNEVDDVRLEKSCMRLRYDVNVDNPEISMEIIWQETFLEEIVENAVCLDVYDHFLVYVGIAHYVTELLEGDFAIFVLVREQDCLVHYLL